jgi:hypothetical protein
MITIARRTIGQHCNFYLYHDERLEISFTTRGRRGEPLVLERLLTAFFQRGGKERACTKLSCGICTNVHLHRTPPVLRLLIPIHPSWFSKANTRKKRGRRKKKGSQQNSRDQIYLERRDIAIESSTYSRRRKRTCLLNASSSSCVTM